MISIGMRVKTVRPQIESKDWTWVNKKARRWGVTGTVVQRSDAHGECFRVYHDDPEGPDSAWYETRELTEID